MTEFEFRRLVAADVAALVRWMWTDHAQPWFVGEPTTVDDALVHYAKELDGTSATRMWVVTWMGRDIGYMQDYPVIAFDDYAVRVQDPEAIAFDYLIGEADVIGRGVGTRMVEAFCRQVLIRDFPDAPRFVASPDTRNHRSIRVLEKCGFTQGLWIHPETEEFPEVVCTASRETFVGGRE